MEGLTEGQLTRKMLEILGRDLVFSHSYKQVKEKGIRKVLCWLRLVKKRYEVIDKSVPSKKLVIIRYSKLVLPTKETKGEVSNGMD